MDQSLLDRMIQKFQNVPPIHLHRVDTDGNVSEWWTINPIETFVPELVIVDANLAEQVQIISASITYWQRFIALAKRVWEVREREYRVWREGMFLRMMTPDPKDSGWKKPTEKLAAAKIRQDPEYVGFYGKIEQAEETYNTLLGMVDGLKAKRDMLKIAVRRNATDGAPYLSV